MYKRLFEEDKRKVNIGQNISIFDPIVKKDYFKAKVIDLNYNNIIKEWILTYNTGRGPHEAIYNSKKNRWEVEE